MQTGNQYSTTLLKAFDILECFRNDCHEIGVTDIAQKVSLPVSSVHRIIQSLEFEGLILQNPETKKYRLGTKILSLAGKCHAYQKYVDSASVFVNELGQLTGETVNLAISSCDSTIHLLRTECSHILRPTFPMNVPFPSYCTAVGRVFLSEMSNSAQRWVYANNADEIDLTEDQFLHMLADVSRNGYALDDESFSPGLRCVAAPIRLSTGYVAFALSVSAPCVRMNDAAYERTRQLTVQYAAKISGKIQSVELQLG